MFKELIAEALPATSDSVSASPLSSAVMAEDWAVMSAPCWDTVVFRAEIAEALAAPAARAAAAAAAASVATLSVTAAHAEPFQRLGVFAPPVVSIHRFWAS
ncbi:hypothetical protein D3C86_1511190 [compost metagenome]